VATALGFAAAAFSVRIKPRRNAQLCLSAKPCLSGDITPMSYSTRLDALKQRHASLDSRIQDEDHRPRPDSDTLMRLKLEKLHLKEEMEKVSGLVA
jgi:hypothetical protein